MSLRTLLTSVRRTTHTYSVVIAVTMITPYVASASWAPHGDSLCTASGTQVLPKIVSDGAGGAIAVWVDNRTSDDANIYANRIEECGVLAGWTADGVPLCTRTGDQVSVQAISDGAGGLIAVWTDNRGTSADIFAQRINGSGVVQWASDGVPVCRMANAQSGPVIASDGAHGAIIAWTDYRAGGSESDIYLQHLDASGSRTPDTTGYQVSTSSGFDYNPQIISDKSGGAVTIWTHDTTLQDLYARHWPGGTFATADSVLPICKADGYQEFPVIAFDDEVSDSNDGFIIAWADHRTGANLDDIYAEGRKLNGQLHDSWVVDGNAVAALGAHQTLPAISASSATGAIIAWRDERNSSDGDIYAQRMLFGGTASWTANGISLCSATDYQNYPVATPAGNGGAMVVWVDQRGGTDLDIYGTLINSDGVRSGTWPSDGQAICSTATTQDHPDVTTDGDGGGIVVWENGGDIYTQRATKYGKVPPSGAPSTVSDLVVEVNNTCDGVNVSWSAPGDEGTSGTAEEYDLRRSTATITSGNFASATRLYSPSGPSAHGETDTYADPVGHCTGPWYYAVESKDHNCTWSSMSNVGQASVPCFQYCSGEGPDLGGAIRLQSVRIEPNPASHELQIRFVQNRAVPTRFAIHDVSGRLVTEFGSSNVRVGENSVSWNLRSSSGVLASPGMYFVTVSVGDQRVQRTVVIR